MSVSRHAIDTVFAQLKVSAAGQTYAELARATGYSRATIKNALSYLKMQGSISISLTRPAVFKAVSMPPMPGQTLIVRETLPPKELDSRILADIKRDLTDTNLKKIPDEMLVAIFHRVKAANPTQLEALLRFFVNLSEVIREMLTTSELDLSDIDPNSLKGKK